MTLQRNLLRHFGKDYFALVLAMKMMWKKETTNLADIILKIICHAEINNENEKNKVDNVNVLTMGTQQKQTLWEMCTTQECID